MQFIKQKHHLRAIDKSHPSFLPVCLTVTPEISKSESEELKKQKAPAKSRCQVSPVSGKIR